MSTGEWMPNRAFVEQVHGLLTVYFADSDDPISPPGVRDTNLLESACARPFIGMGKRLKYRTKLERAAALFHSLVQNHAFHNGNKRTALVTLLTLINSQSRTMKSTVTDKIIYDFVCAVANSRVPSIDKRLDNGAIIRAIVNWLKENTEDKNRHISEMDSDQFIEFCTSFGASIKPKSKNTMVTFKGKSINVPHHKLAGQVVKKYLSTLKFHSFNAEDDSRQKIQQYKELLRRLAKT